MMMKTALRRCLAACLVAIALTTYIAPALAAEGTVNTSSLILRKSASKSSKALQTLDKGTELEVLNVSGDWYKVSYGRYTGYVMKKYLTVKGSVEEESASLRVGSRGTAVKNVQQKLKDLGYYTGKVDGIFGSGTEKAVKAFQKSQKLTQDGRVGDKTLKALESAKKTTAASKTTASSKTTATTTTKKKESTSLRPGSIGSAVKSLQQKLKDLGLFTGKVDGVYGDDTVKAVKALQKAKKLTQDGIAGEKTMEALNKAKKSDFAIKTESLDWFKNTNVIPKRAVFTVKDVKTGKTFTVRRWSGANHIDAEPLTAADTAAMKSIYGGSWSWDRRAILVKYNGHVYAASMNGMPHGTSTISSNNFAGHFCIHFTNSRTHESNKVDAAHQNAVRTALKYTW